jgi:hypothetical protein
LLLSQGPCHAQAIEPPPVAIADPAPAASADSAPAAIADPAPVASADSAPVASADSAKAAVADPAPAASADPAPSAIVDPAPVASADPAPAAVADPAPVAIADPAPSAIADSAPVAIADPAPAAIADPAPVAAAVSLADLLDMLKDQQSQLEDQKRQLEAQTKIITSLQVQVTTDMTAEKETITKQAQQIEEQRQSMASMQTQIDQINQKSTDEMSKEDVALRSRLETLESSIKASQEAANTTFDEDSFPNSIMIPGTNAAFKMGGFVKVNIVETFDPLGSLDRFIAGSIPVPQESSTPRTSMTVSQSRLNYDLRDKTKFGTMRAYVEGDFAGEGDTFRLRHAYGQFKELLVGKTWSVFQDTDAAPEEIDFEGINGAVNVRQPQVRYFSKLGHDWALLFSLEDPNPEVTGGTATSKLPDVVASARRTLFDRWHIRSSVVLRQITAIWDKDTTGDSESQETGWGLSLSGKTATQFLNPNGLDSIMFQFNVGEGIGRYINDLNTIGGEDAIFGPTGNLETLPVLAGYVAYQHWWRGNARSTMNLSWVNVNNLSFEDGTRYHKTFRGALNYIWSPTSRIDIGAEVIYGTRQNKNGEKASASQVQISSKYRF